MRSKLVGVLTGLLVGVILFAVIPVNAANNSLRARVRRLENNVRTLQVQTQHLTPWGDWYGGNFLCDEGEELFVNEEFESILCVPSSESEAEAQEALRNRR